MSHKKKNQNSEEEEMSARRPEAVTKYQKERRRGIRRYNRTRQKAADEARKSERPMNNTSTDNQGWEASIANDEGRKEKRRRKENTKAQQ